MRLPGLFAVTLAVAAGTCVGALWATPRLIMDRAIDKIGAVGTNTMLHQGLPDHRSRTVVRPSPDLAYSTCVFDLAGGPVVIDARVPPGRYWSLSVFDRRTDNIFSVNDSGVSGGRFRLVLSKDGRDGSLSVPGGKGIALIRILVTDAEDLAGIDALRRRSTCSATDAR